jgi:murein L,D-transpeptidase YcbB/YkuD
MNQMVEKIFIGIAFFALAGCATTRPGDSALESRVQSLENRLQVVEADIQSTGRISGDTSSAPDSFGTTATVETMTKKQVQEALKSAGYYNGSIDGKIGPQTREAITQFQKDMGLQADGVAGRKTKEKLLKYLG